MLFRLVFLNLYDVHVVKSFAIEIVLTYIPSLPKISIIIRSHSNQASNHYQRRTFPLPKYIKLIYQNGLRCDCLFHCCCSRRCYGLREERLYCLGPDGAHFRWTIGWDIIFLRNYSWIVHWMKICYGHMTLMMEPLGVKILSVQSLTLCLQLNNLCKNFLSNTYQSIIWFKPVKPDALTTDVDVCALTDSSSLDWMRLYFCSTIFVTQSHTY